MSHRLPADQFVVGLVLNVLVLGLVGFLTSEIEPQSDRRQPRRASPCSQPSRSSVPALFDQPWVLYLVYPLVPAIWWLLYRTRWGLEVRAVGEDPNASDVSGLHVNKLRRQTIYLAGLTAGLGGGYFLFARVGAVRGLVDRWAWLHRHRRGHLRRVDAEGHGRRMHPVRSRRLVRPDDSLARLQQRSTRRSWRWPRTS